MNGNKKTNNKERERERFIPIICLYTLYPRGISKFTLLDSNFVYILLPLMRSSYPMVVISSSNVSTN